MADTPLSALKRSVSSPVAGFPVKAPSSLRPPNMRSTPETSIGSGPTPRTIETPPGRSPLKVLATVFPPDAVIRTTLAPPSARDLDRLRPDAEDDRDAAWTQPLEGLSDR